MSFASQIGALRVWAIARDYRQNYGMPVPRLILASASPRRQSLLRQAGFDFIVHPAHIDEENHPPALKPAALAEFLARTKAASVAAQFPEDIVLGADTVVALNDKCLGKPIDASDARSMLQKLSGTTHAVITGVALQCLARGITRLQTIASTVQMRPLSAEEIDRYVATEDWRGKAGGYGIQDHDPFVMRVSGSHTNIVGLPMEAVEALLAEAGIERSRR